METSRDSPLRKSPCPACFQITGVDATTPNAAISKTDAMSGTRHRGILFKCSSYRFTVSLLQCCPATT